MFVAVALKVIEKHAANAPHFSTMLHQEVFVAPFLESRIELRIMSIANGPDNPMEVCGVLRVRIARCEVRPSSKPLGITLFQISEVRVDCRYHRAARMEYA